MTDKERTLTTYQVFRIEGSTWVPLSQVETSAGTYACQQVAQEAQVEGEYRAVPVRNITEVTMGYQAPPPPKLVPLVEDAPHSVAVPPAQAPQEEEAQTLAAQVLDEPPLAARIRAEP